MAKQSEKTEKQPEKSPEKKEGNLSERKSVEISINKYLQLYAPEIHPYTRAYVEQRFRGIMKSKGSWDEAIKKHMEGDR